MPYHILESPRQYWFFISCIALNNCLTEDTIASLHNHKRYNAYLPAIMFLIGAFIGMTVRRLDNAIAQSALTWVGIEGEVILLVFLPGLLFLDSYNIDVHLFISSFAQLLTFAFPMVSYDELMYVLKLKTCSI